jgi:hypothetical protein
MKQGLVDVFSSRGQTNFLRAHLYFFAGTRRAGRVAPKSA